MSAGSTGRRRVFVDDLVTASEISRKFGITTTTWTGWVVDGRYSIPEPVTSLTERNIRVWLESEIDAWALQRRGMAPWLSAQVLLNTASMSAPGESPDDLLSQAATAAMCNWKNPSTPYQQHLNGTFPTPAVVSGRTKMWRRGDVQAWTDAHPVGPSGTRRGRPRAAGKKNR